MFVYSPTRWARSQHFLFCYISLTSPHFSPVPSYSFLPQRYPLLYICCLSDNFSIFNILIDIIKYWDFLLGIKLYIIGFIL